MPEPYEIIIGQTTGQDLLLDLGPPLRKFWKEDDRMERIWGRADTKLEDGECECDPYGLELPSRCPILHLHPVDLGHYHAYTQSSQVALTGLTGRTLQASASHASSQSTAISLLTLSVDQR